MRIDWLDFVYGCLFAACGIGAVYVGHYQAHQLTPFGWAVVGACAALSAYHFILAIRASH